MTTDNSDIKALLSGSVAAGAGADTGQSLATDQWREEGPWLLLLLLPIAALAFRRGLVIGLAFFVLPLTEPAHAFSWDDLWLNKNQQGQKKLAEGLPEEAAQLFRDPQWRAVAEYEAGNFASSARAFADRDDASSLYNLGNAMGRAGKFESAIEAYDQALEQTPDDEDTVYNRDLVEKMLQQQEQGDQQDGQQSDPESGGQSQQSESESDANQESQPDSSGESGNESNEGEAGRNEQETNQEDLQAMREELERAAAEAEARETDPSETEAMSEAQAEAMRRAQEQTQSMEQWLRRIENDPGGLLRRKFRYQYQREGRDQDGNSVWPDDDVEPW